MDAALALLPGWVDSGKTETKLTRRKKRTDAETNLDNFHEKSNKDTTK